MKVHLSGFEPIIEHYRLGEEYFRFICDLEATICEGFVNSLHLGIPQCNADSTAAALTLILVNKTMLGSRGHVSQAANNNGTTAVTSLTTK